MGLHPGAHRGPRRPCARSPPRVYRDDLAPLLHLVQDISGDRDLVAGALMAFCKVCKATTDRDLAIARLVADLETDRAAAIEELP